MSNACLTLAKRIWSNVFGYERNSLWLNFSRNGILCAYLRATEPSTPSVEATPLQPALDRELHDVLGIEVRRVRRERRAGRVLDPLVDRQNRHVAGAGEAAVQNSDCRLASTRGGRSDAP